MKQTFLFLLLIISGFASAQNILNVGSTTQRVLDSTYNKLLDKNKVVGTSIAIVDNGKIVYANGFGFMDKENEVPADAETIYRIGSCTKSFTVMAIMSLQNKGLLSINEPIQKYLPELTIPSRFTEQNDILIKDIMSHTSGLPCDIANGFFCDAPPDLDWVIQQLNLMTMSAPAGYQHAYSNVGYGLLGELIERVSGMDYESYIQEAILGPMKMNNTYVFDSSGHTKHLSKAYLDKKMVHEPNIRDYAAGLIHSNVLDMAEYLKIYLSRGTVDGTPVISAESIFDMETNALEDLKLQTRGAWGYGLYKSTYSAIHETDTSEISVIGHGGDTWAYHADFKYIPELGVGAVVLTNTDNGARISSAYRVLSLYLKNEKNTTIAYSKKDKPVYPGEVLCGANEIPGFYGVSGLLINVKKPNKFKFKQGPALVVFKKAKDRDVYTAKAKLLYVIPIKIRNQEFKFVKKDNETYLKVMYTRDSTEDYISKKSDLKVSETWKNRVGKYVPATKVFPCEDCRYMDFEDVMMELKMKDGKLFAYMTAKSKDIDDTFVLEVVSDTLCITSGIGRNTGETMRILENGNLYYSGFEFKRK